MSTVEDKRQFKRVSLKSMLLYRVEEIPDTNRNELLAVETPLSIDISEGGCQFLSMQKIPAGTLLRLMISLEEAVHMIEMTGQVIWTLQKSGSDNYFTGVKFIFLEENARDLVKEFISVSPEL